MSENPSKPLAERIADRLFASGAGVTASRLALFAEDQSGDKKRDLGGWCYSAVIRQVAAAIDETPREPIPMRIACPDCGTLHIDEGEFATKPHHTHACQVCGLVWRPAIVPTVGVRFLPGFKNETPPALCPHCGHDPCTDECRESYQPHAGI